MRLSRNAKRGLKLTAKLEKIERGELQALVAEAVDSPDWSDADQDGRPRRYKELPDGGYVRVVLALDQPDFVVSIHPRSKLG